MSSTATMARPPARTNLTRGSILSPAGPHAMRLSERPGEQRDHYW